MLYQGNLRVCVCSTNLNAQPGNNMPLWNLSGNSIQDGDFLGTTNNRALIFKSNSVEGFRLLPNGYLGIGINNPQALLDIGGDAIFRENLFAHGNIILGENSNFIFPENFSMTLAFLEIENQLKIGNSLFLNHDNEIYTASNSGSLYIQSDKYNQNTIINLNNDGYVGIGTDTPEKKLHVKHKVLTLEPIPIFPADTIIFNETFFNNSIEERDNLIANEEIRGSIRIETEAEAVATGNIHISKWDIEPAASPLVDYPHRLHFKDAMGGHTVMTMVGNGTVGIGTGAPGARLHVHNGNMAVTNGRIGIGIQKPSAELDVAGRTVITHTSSDSAPLQLINNSSNGSALEIMRLGQNKANIKSNGDAYFSGLVSTNKISVKEKIVIGNKEENSPGNLTVEHCNDSPWSYGINVKVSHANTKAFAIQNEELSDEETSDIFRVWGNGVVNAKAIWAEALKIRPYFGNPWPDYVFDDNYELMPLNEVENFIAKNKHLPLIPNEDEINENGLDIGEMQKLQMQKIEELTLYIIEMNKRIEQLEKENQEHKNK